jgi:hypothetical protein
MAHSTLTIFLTVLFFAAWVPGSKGAYAQKVPVAIAEVKAALDRQVNAWNAADLENAMKVYWNSPEMLWVSRSGIEKGYLPILEGYRKDFQNKTKMGIYTYEPLHIEQISKTSVLYVYRWKIELNGKRTMGGVSSQIWKKINNIWVITAEHAS